jgi:hypothetical protein
MNTPTMRERLCRAACVAAGLDPDRKYKSSSDDPANAPFEYAWQEFGKEVDAILDELREPDEAMREEALISQFDFAQDGSEAVVRAFTAMIDSIREGK